MLASQLLRVFQTMPSEMKHETCVFDAEEQNMNMKENQNATVYDSKSFGKEADTLAFEGNGVQVNGSRRTNDPIAFEGDGGGKHWNTNIVADLSSNCERARLDSPRKSSAAKGEEKLKSSPAYELSNADKKSESSYFGSPQITTSDLLEKDSDFCTDKNILECESHELTVCDKDINLHYVKDICIDEGISTKDKILIESCKDYQPGVGDINNVFVISNGLEAASLGNTRSVGETEYGNIGVSYDELLAQCRSKSPSGNLSADDNAKNCEMENSMQVGETNCVGSDNSEKESYVDSKLPIQEFGMRRSLRSFLQSLDDEGNKAVEQRDEIFLGEEGSKIPELVVEVESDAVAKKDMEPNTVLYDSKIEGRSITIDFNSPEQMISIITNVQTENLMEQFVESGKVSAHRDGTADNISDSSLAQCASINENATGDAREQAIDVKNEDSDRSSEAILVQQVNEDMKNKGESSSTAAGLITFSGPIAYSGSLSLRSDVSAASSRSFAFPILQSEWNSSPVRMAKADRRHFRRHKGWRSGLLCCRF